MSTNDRNQNHICVLPLFGEKAGATSGKLILSLIMLVLPLTTRAQFSANSISFQGALTGAGGQPLANGNYDLTFKFYDVPNGGAALATSSVPNVPVTGGIASTPIPVDAAWFNGQTRHLGIAISGGTELSTRVLVTAVPYALKAASLTASSPLDSTSHVPQQQGLELRWYQNTPFIDFTMAPTTVRLSFWRSG
jgi:hypothetical protein